MKKMNHCNKCGKVQKELDQKEVEMVISAIKAVRHIVVGVFDRKQMKELKNDYKLKNEMKQLLGFLGW